MVERLATTDVVSGGLLRPARLRADRFVGADNCGRRRTPCAGSMRRSTRTVAGFTPFRAIIARYRTPNARCGCATGEQQAAERERA